MLKLITKVFKINKYIFPLLISLAFISLGIETCSYFGFLSKYIWVDSKFFLVLALFSTTFMLGEKPNALDDLVFRVNFIVFPSSVVLYILMQYLESSHFPNYIFSTYHIQLVNFLYIVLLSLVLFYISKLPRQKSFFLNTPLFKLVIVFIFTMVLLDGAVMIMKVVVPNDIYILSHLNASYDFKMKERWGIYYDYIKFVKANTPGNASILVPPQKFPWPSSGNVGLDRYFLFPRNLRNGSYNEPIDLSKYDYVLLVWGEEGGVKSDYGWPKIFIKAEKIIYFDPITCAVTEKIENYNPKLVPASGSWGIIKVKQ